MYTREDSPWVEYLEIDEITLERRLSSNAPDEIKRAYEQHLKVIRDNSDKAGRIFK